MNRKVLIAALAASSMLMGGCGELHVGYADYEKLLETPQIKAVLEEGDAKMQEIQTAAEAELSGREDLTDEEIQKVQSDVQRKLAGLQQAYFTQYTQKMNAAAEAVSKEKSLEIIIDSSENQKMVFTGGIDVTEDLVKKLQ